MYDIYRHVHVDIFCDIHRHVTHIAIATISLDTGHPTTNNDWQDNDIFCIWINKLDIPTELLSDIKSDSGK